MIEVGIAVVVVVVACFNISVVVVVWCRGCLLLGCCCCDDVVEVVVVWLLFLCGCRRFVVLVVVVVLRRGGWCGKMGIPSQQVLRTQLDAPQYLPSKKQQQLLFTALLFSLPAKKELVWHYHYCILLLLERSYSRG